MSIMSRRDVSEGFDDLREQLWLVQDYERVNAYARALREVVRPGDVVADLGTGTGVLAVLAARAGARKVYAIERGGIADLAQRVFRENGVADRVEILRGDARDVVFPEPPNVVVSETLGCFGIEEDIVALLKMLRPRCAPDVRFVPSAVDLMLGPVWDEGLERELAELDDIAGVSLAPLRAQLVHKPTVQRLLPEQMMGKGQRAARFELSRDALPAIYRATLPIERDGYANAIGGWFVAQLSPSVSLTNAPDAPRTSWSHAVLPLEPALRLTAGAQLEVEVQPRFAGVRALWCWSARLKDGEQREGAALASSGGSLRDAGHQLGIGTIAGNQKVASPRLEAWSAILQGDASPSIDELAARLLAKMPQRYAGMEDAREEVIRLLDACDAIA
jgi:hypothetical protein